MLVAKGVVFRYGSHFGGVPHDSVFELQCLKFEACGGQVTGIIGANGSGKTTLLNLLAGQEKPAQGEIRLNNKILSQLGGNERRHLIGRVHMDNPQMLVDDLLVVDHVALSMIASGKHIPLFPRLLLHRRAEESFPAFFKKFFLDIGSLLNRKVSSLSSGQRQGLGNLLGFSVGQNLLMADEGTATLDAIRATEFVQWIKELGRRDNIPVLLASHDLRLVAEYTDKVYILENGFVSEISGFEHRDKQRRLDLLEERIGASMKEPERTSTADG